MNAEVYAKSAKSADHALRAEGKNRIDLSDAEENTLRKALDKQLQAHHINGLQLQIMQAIFHHTIGFNKLEDDITGTFLEKVLGSRYDYCNKNVTQLIEHSILISRRGHYGRILAINYHLEDWGKKPQDTPNKSNDPRLMLAEQRPIESAETSPENPKTSSADTPSEQAVSNPSVLQNDVLTSLLEQALPDDFTRLITQNICDSITTAFAASLKTALEQITPQILLQMTNLTATINPDSHNPSETETQAKVHSEEPIAENQPQTESQLHTQVAEITAQKVETQAEKTETEPEHTQAKAAQTPDKTQAKAAHTLEQSQEKTPEISPNTEAESLEECPEIPTKIAVELAPEITGEAQKTNDYETLIYPEQLKPFEQKHIQTILEKEQIDDAKTAQTLLDSMRSRFNLDMEPIKSPVAYFRSLIKSLKAGSFETSYADIFTQQEKEKHRQTVDDDAHQKHSTYQEKYNTAANNYKSLKLRMSLTDKSMRELAKDLGWMALIDEMGFDLDVDMQATA